MKIKIKRKTRKALQPHIYNEKYYADDNDVQLKTLCLLGVKGFVSTLLQRVAYLQSC